MNLENIKAYCKDPKNRNTVNVGLFIFLIISFHYLYLGWQAIGYWPIGKAIDKLMVWSVNLVFSHELLNSLLVGDVQFLHIGIIPSMLGILLLLQLHLISQLTITARYQYIHTLIQTSVLLPCPSCSNR